MAKRILLTGDFYTPDQFEKLAAKGFEVKHRTTVDRAELCEIVPEIHAYVLGGDERLDAEILERAALLKLISFVGTGYGAFIDLAAAKERDIAIMNTPNMAIPAVAEHTIGMVIGLARGLFSQNESIKRTGMNLTTHDELAHIPVGIVGMGAIAARVSRILREGFGCSVAYTNRTRKIDIEHEIRISYTDLESLFRASKLVILLVASAAETHHLVDEHLLSGAQDGMMLVNTASAHLVDPNALCNALKSGKVASAAFDGYWIEPLPAPESDPFGLLSLPDDRFVVSPHTAAKTSGTWSRMVRMAVQNILESERWEDQP